MKVEHITIAGMVLTIVLSLGGSYAGYLVKSSEQTMQLETLTLESSDHKKANKIVYELETQMEHSRALAIRQQEQIDNTTQRLAESEIGAARREANQINIIKSMDRLIISVEKLVTKVDE